MMMVMIKYSTEQVHTSEEPLMLLGLYFVADDG